MHHKCELEAVMSTPIDFMRVCTGKFSATMQKRSHCCNIECCTISFACASIHKLAAVRWTTVFVAHLVFTGNKYISKQTETGSNRCDNYRCDGYLQDLVPTVLGAQEAFFKYRQRHTPL
jgi:hypothetical protein